MSGWTAEIVRERFIEAAETELFLPGIRLGNGAGYWPEYSHDQNDRDGWDDQAKLDNSQRWRGRATASAIARHQECMDWTVNYIGDEMRRRLVWAWAFCKVKDRDFGSECRYRGWNRSTANSRLHRLFADLADKFHHNGVLLRKSERPVKHDSPFRAMHDIRLANSDQSPTAIPHIPLRIEKPRDLLQSPEAIAEFQTYLAKINKMRRRRVARWRNKELAESA